MTPYSQAAEIFDFISGIKRNATGFTSSLFAGPEDVQRWIESGAWSSFRGSGSLVAFRQERDITRVYHVAASAGDLHEALRSVVAIQPSRSLLTADLIGLEGDVERIAAVYGRHGFSGYTSLIRMVRAGGDSSPVDVRFPEVEFANPGDLPVVEAFLRETLDPIRDQIPNTEAIEAALAQRNVLIERRGRELGGMLYFETTGLTSHLRYWYVDPQLHNQGIGGRLLKTWLRTCSDCRRFILWVVEFNEDTIARYRHYGFRFDKLVDQIVIRREELQS